MTINSTLYPSPRALGILELEKEFTAFVYVSKISFPSYSKHHQFAGRILQQIKKFTLRT